MLTNRKPVLLQACPGLGRQKVLVLIQITAEFTEPKSVMGLQEDEHVSEEINRFARRQIGISESS
jgi:hypothetical protein